MVAKELLVSRIPAPYLPVITFPVTEHPDNVSWEKRYAKIPPPPGALFPLIVQPTSVASLGLYCPPVILSMEIAPPFAAAPVPATVKPYIVHPYMERVAGDTPLAVVPTPIPRVRPVIMTPESIAV